jgi:hypothetical protein
MSQMHPWTLEEMARSVNAERLAEVERDRLAQAARGAGASPRVVLANALRAVASLLDGEARLQARPERRLVRAA